MTTVRTFATLRELASDMRGLSKEIVSIRGNGYPCSCCGAG